MHTQSITANNLQWQHFPIAGKVLAIYSDAAAELRGLFGTFVCPPGQFCAFPTAPYVQFSEAISRAAGAANITLYLEG
jgi:hypothetical protein